MIGKTKSFVRTLFRYLYFRMVKLFDIALNSRKVLFPLNCIRRILLVEVQDIGDTIIASPCIRQLRKRFPNANMDMLVQHKSLDMVRYNPNLNEAFSVHNITSYPRLLGTALACRRQQYDLVISLSPSVRNNLIAVLSGGKIISGYLNDGYFYPTNYHDQIIELRGHKASEETIWHKEEPLILRALKAAGPLGVDLTDSVDTELFLPPEMVEFADAFLKRHGVGDSDIIVGLHPVSLNYFRNWAPEKFAQLADALIERFENIRIFLIGSHDDRATLDQIISLIKHDHNLICDTSLSILQTASIIHSCTVLVGTDSCPSDISGALGIPTVHMHGPTSSRVTGPGGKNNFPVSLGLPCSPCGLNVHSCPYDKKCMRDLDVSKVYDATLRAIESWRQGISVSVTQHVTPASQANSDSTDCAFIGRAFSSCP